MDVYCTKCFAFIPEDATVCPECNCEIETDSLLTQEIISAEMEFQKQGYNFEMYSIYKTRSHFNNDYEETQEKKHNESLKYLPHWCIAISLGILIFGLDEFSIINAIIAIVLGYVASAILKKFLNKSHKEEVKGQLIAKDDKKTMLSSQYEEKVLKPLEDNVIAKVLSSNSDIQTDYSLKNITEDRANFIWILCKAKNGKFATLQEYTDQLYARCWNKLRRKHIEGLIKEVSEEVSDLKDRVGIYSDNLYSAYLKAKLPDLDKIQYPDHDDNNGALVIQNIKDKLSNLRMLLDSEQENIKTYLDKLSTIKNDFKIFKKKVSHLLYFSKAFQEHFRIVESATFVSPKSVKEFEKLKDKVDKAEYSLKELQTLYDEENAAVNDMYEQQKKLADELTAKLEAVLSENTDVKYGGNIDSLISEIRKLISVYEKGASALNPDLVNDKIKMLTKARKHERAEVFSTIQNYEKQLQILQKEEEIYDRPNSGVIAERFLERKMKN